MRLAEWISGFRALHERSKKGELSPQERETYLAAREELARAFLAAQRVQTKPGQSYRSAMRVSRALQADLELASGKVRSLTLDLSINGFAALLANAPPPGEKVGFMLRLPGGVQLSGAARVVAIAAHAGNARVSFTFADLSPADAETVEVLVFDTVLEHIKIP